MKRVETSLPTASPVYPKERDCPTAARVAEIGPLGLRACLAAVLAVMLSGALQPPVSAAAASPTDANVLPSQDLVLKYRDTAEMLVQGSLVVKRQAVAFPKEPALSVGEVVRGQIQWGASPESGMGFIWERDKRTLRLDLNRNRDLTDDAQGVYVGATNYAWQVFSNIHLSRPVAGGMCPLAVRLEVAPDQREGVQMSAGLCSFWEAKLSVQGGDLQFGLLENALEGKAGIGPAYLLLRPWAERDRPYNLRSSSPDFTEYTTNLFFGGRAYEVGCRFVLQGEKPAYQVSLKERSMTLGELKVSGEFLHRLILKGDKGLTVVLDQPGGVVKIPQASYAVEEVWVRKGELEASRFKAGRVRVEQDRTAVLVAGGPLTNSVKARPQGMDLALNYELLGADGAAYRLPRPDYKNPPHFAIYQGTNRLAADKFRYG